MGVSGSGKSTVGAALAERLAVPFLDADDFHPASNVEKMAARRPLTDDDRWPWLDRTGEAIRAETGGVVLACSALRLMYRERLRSFAPEAIFVQLAVPRAVLGVRMGERVGHFMPKALLDSQLGTLESLTPMESGLVVDGALTERQIVDTILADDRMHTNTREDNAR